VVLANASLTMPQSATYTWHGTAAGKKLRAAAALGLGKWAELVLQQSREVVPLDEATLERSGVASVDDQALEAAVSYDTPYAVAQHENLEYRHAPGRAAKYLERPWLQSMKWALPLIQKELRKVTK
jgi:hypothetical protein